MKWWIFGGGKTILMEILMKHKCIYEYNDSHELSSTLLLAGNAL
jgi:hypothetical protein